MNKEENNIYRVCIIHGFRHPLALGTVTGGVGGMTVLADTSSVMHTLHLPICPCHPAQRSRNWICRDCLLPWPSGFYLGPTKGKPQQEMEGWEKGQAGAQVP